MADDGPSKRELQEFHEGLFGKPPKQRVHFITQRWLDVAESLRKEAETGDHAGSRTEVPRVFMAKISNGLKHSRLYLLASDQDIADHPAEFAEYLEEIKRGNQESFQRWSVDGRDDDQPSSDHLQGVSGSVRPPIESAFARDPSATDGLSAPTPIGFQRETIGAAFVRAGFGRTAA